MTFLFVYALPFFVAVIFGSLIEWFQNRKGRRAITLKNALYIIGAALIPIVNIVVAVVCLVLCLALVAEKMGLFDWVEDIFYRAQRIVLLTDHDKQ